MGETGEFAFGGNHVIEIVVVLGEHNLGVVETDPESCLCVKDATLEVTPGHGFAPRSTQALHPWTISPGSKLSGTPVMPQYATIAVVLRAPGFGSQNAWTTPCCFLVTRFHRGPAATGTVSMSGARLGLVLPVEGLPYRSGSNRLLSTPTSVPHTSYVHKVLCVMFRSFLWPCSCSDGRPHKTSRTPCSQKHVSGRQGRP